MSSLHTNTQLDTFTLAEGWEDFAWFLSRQVRHSTYWRHSRGEAVWALQQTKKTTWFGFSPKKGPERIFCLKWFWSYKERALSWHFCAYKTELPPCCAFAVLHQNPWFQTVFAFCSSQVFVICNHHWFQKNKVKIKHICQRASSCL